MTIDEARAVLKDLVGIVEIVPQGADKKKRLAQFAKLKLVPSDKIADGQLTEAIDDKAGTIAVSHGRYNAFIAAWNFLMKANLGKTNFPAELPVTALATQATILLNREPPKAVVKASPAATAHAKAADAKKAGGHGLSNGAIAGLFLLGAGLVYAVTR